MRFVSFAAVATALTLFVTSFPVEAKYRERSEWVRLRVKVNKPQSYLYAGTSVKPGTMRYTNYLGLYEQRFPAYGPPNNNINSRFPLPLPYELPGY